MSQRNCPISPSALPKSLPVMGALFIAILCAFPMPAFAAASTEATAQAARPQKIVIKMSHFTDDLHAAAMALKLGNMLLKRGQEVTYFFNLESVRLVDKRSNADLSWGKHAMSLLKLYEDAVAAGAKVVVCPHCAETAGIKTEHLRGGAKMGDDVSIADLMIQADKVIDY
jgi:predicted peroxiredoxin